MFEDPVQTWAFVALIWGAYFGRKIYQRGVRDGRAQALPPPAPPPAPAWTPPEPRPTLPRTTSEASEDVTRARTRATIELEAMGFPSDLVARAVSGSRDTDWKTLRDRAAASILAQ